MGINVVFLAALVLLGCSSAFRYYNVTPEGWVIYYTSDQQEVARACGEPDNSLIIGCARWTEPDPPALPMYPVKECDIYVYTKANETIDYIVQHELRHCREGHFHE